MLRRGALSSQLSTAVHSILPSIRDVPNRNHKAMEPNSQRGKTPRSHMRSGTDSQSSGNRGSPYRGRGQGGRGRGKPRRRGRGGNYTDRTGTAAGAAGAGAGAAPSMDMGTSQFTGFPMQPFMPFQGPGTDVSGSFNAPWWGVMNPAAGALPFIPPHPSAINPNFPMPAMPAMFNPTIPMFSPFNSNGALNAPRHHDVANYSYPDPNDRPRVDNASDSPEAPEATAQYLAQASLPASPTQTAQPLLIILDLNGTLIHRRNRKFPPNFTRRSLLNNFLNTLLLKHKVMVWSSSQPKTVKAICQQLFSPMQRKALLAEWGRDKLNLTTSQYKSKVQVYKTLETVWADPAVQSKYPKPILDNDNGNGNENAKSRWDQSNTVLIDDSKLKALSEPFNIIELPEFEGFETPGQDGETIFPKVLSRLDMLSKHDDVSKVLHGWSRTAKDTGKDFLDFELDELDRRHIFSPSGVIPEHPNPEQTQTRSTKEETQIQKRLLRKAMKHERKAAKEARDFKSVYHNTNSPLNGGTPDAGSEQGDTTQHDNGLISKERKRQMREQKRKHKRAEQRAERRDQEQRSPSVSSQSENQLLDRLEESLTV